MTSAPSLPPRKNIFLGVLDGSAFGVSRSLKQCERLAESEAIEESLAQRIMAKFDIKTPSRLKKCTH